MAEITEDYDYIMETGDITGTTISNQYIDVKIKWFATMYPNKNHSNIVCILKYKRNNTGYVTKGTGTFSITINGIKQTFTKYLEIGTSWVEAGTVSIAGVKHSSDGWATVSISAEGSIPGTTLTETGLSGTIKLYFPPTATTLDTIYSYQYLSGVLGYRFTPKSDAYYNRFVLYFRRDGKYTPIKTIDHGKQPATQQTNEFTLSESECSIVYTELSAYKQVLVRFAMLTYADPEYSNQIGEASYSDTYLKFGAAVHPYVSASVTPSHSLTGDFANLYVQGKSKVKATITASGKYGATITDQKMEVEGVTYDSGDSFTSGYLSRYGTIAVKITATDSRGFSQTVTKNITVLAYSNPSVVPASGESSIICARCDSSGKLTESGTYLKIKAKRSYSLCEVDGKQKNLCGLRYRYKAVGGEFSSWITLLGAETLTTEEVDTIQMDGKLAASLSYVVHVDAVDVVGNHSYVTFNIPTDSVYMHRAGSKNSLGLGKYAERKNAFDCGWDIYMNNHRVSGLPTPTMPTDAVPLSYIDPADIKLSKSLDGTGWYKIGTLSGNMCAVATLTVGGVYVNNQASPSMVDIATQYNQARTFLRLPSLADSQISKIGVVKEKTTEYGVYAYYNTSNVNTVDINIHIHMGTFESGDLVISSVAEDDMLTVITLKA